MSLNSAICVARVSIPAVTWQSASLGVTDRRCPYPGMLPLLSALVGPAVVKMTTQSPSRNGASLGHNEGGVMYRSSCLGLLTKIGLVIGHQN